MPSCCKPGLILRVIADVRVGDERLDFAVTQRQAIAGRQHVAQLGLALQLLPLDGRAAIAGHDVGVREAGVVVGVFAVQLVGDHLEAEVLARRDARR